MEEKRGIYHNIDLAYIFRRLYKNAFVILVCACIVGVISYIGMDLYMKPVYQVGATLVVVPRDNNPDRLWEANIAGAVTRSVNVLNSGTMLEQVKESEDLENIEGALVAAERSGTNALFLVARSETAESAYRLLKAALTTYPQLSSYFETGYLLRPLANLSATDVTVEEPQSLTYAILLGILTLALGCGIVFCMCLFSDRIYNEEQAIRLLDMDILGSLHFVRKKKGQKKILVSSDMTEISYAEEMDKIVTRLQKRMDTQKYKILMVGGINENDGKSTVTANIALLLAKRGKNVLLIDMDLRKPALVKIFNHDVAPGKEFTDYLNGTAVFNEVLDSSDKKNRMYHVWQKNPIPNSDKLLENGILKETLEVVGKLVGYVIIDTPPLGIVRDTEIIAGYADAAVLVLKQDKVSAMEVNDAVDMLEDAGTTVIGGVLNMVRGDTSYAGHKSRYEKYYYGYKKE